MQAIQHQAVDFSYYTDAELERFCNSTLPSIPAAAQEELLKRFGNYMPEAPAISTKYK